MLDKNAIYALLQERQIAFKRLEHQPIYTMAEGAALIGDRSSCVCKNLFLQAGRGAQYFLLTVPAAKAVHLRSLRQQLGCQRLSFATAEQLQQYLGLTPGSVSPLGLLNDEERAVTWVADASLQAEATLALHPNDNSATIWLSFADLRQLLAAHGSRIIILPCEASYPEL